MTAKWGNKQNAPLVSEVWMCHDHLWLIIDVVQRDRHWEFDAFCLTSRSEIVHVVTFVEARHWERVT